MHDCYLCGLCEAIVDRTNLSRTILVTHNILRLFDHAHFKQQLLRVSEFNTSEIV